MALRDKVIIELSTEDLHGTGYHFTNLALPATDGQIEDAMQKARAIGREDYVQINVQDFLSLWIQDLILHQFRK